MEVTKQGKFGTLHLFEITYNQESFGEAPMFSDMTARLWGYDEEHALEKFYGCDDEGWKALRIKRVPASGGLHRVNGVAL